VARVVDGRFTARRDAPFVVFISGCGSRTTNSMSLRPRALPGAPGLRSQPRLRSREGLGASRDR